MSLGLQCCSASSGRGRFFQRGFSMSLRNVALSTALLLALTTLVFGQVNPPPPPPTAVIIVPPQYSSNSAAYQWGFQDGVANGQQDRQNNEQFRSTKTEKFE